MKLSIRENLSRFNLIKEGWMENLSDKYNEDILIFTGRMLQQAFPGEDISNNSMAEWIAKSTKESFPPLPWKEPHKTKIEDAFQDILNFIKESENQNEEISKIKSKKPKDALKYVEEQIRKKSEEARRKAEEENVSPEEELKEWLSKGYMKVIGRGPKGSFWVQPLKGEFFGVAQCQPLSSGGGSQNVGEFGIGCQRGETGGMGSVGFGRDRAGQTYTLLGKAKNGYYTALISTGYNPNTDQFSYHSLQYGNQNIGSQGWENWSADDFANAFVDFMINNPYGVKMYKEEGDRVTTNENGVEISDSNRLPSRFSTLKKNKPIFYKLLREHPHFFEYYQKALKNELGEEEFALFQIKAEDLYQSDPVRFMDSLPLYLKTEKDKVLDILKSMDFKKFIDTYGEESIVRNLSDIIKTIDYENFNKLIKPYINFKSFLDKTSSEDLKELLRHLSEKQNSPTKFASLLNDFIEGNEEKIMNIIGDGLGPKSGFVKLLNFFKTPRLKKHQNYTIKDGVLTATFEEDSRDENGNLIDSQGRVIMTTVTDEDGNQRVEIYDENGRVLNFNNEEEKLRYINSRKNKVLKSTEIPPSFYILDFKRIRDFLKKNKDLYKNIYGNDEKAEINFTRQMLLNSNEQERERLLKKEKDKFISYFDSEKKKGNTELPGILEYSKVLYPGAKVSPAVGMKEGIKIYKLDKKDIKEYFNTLLKFYYENSEGKNYQKFSNALNAMLEVQKASNIHENEIKKEIEKYLNVIYKKFGSDGLIDFIENHIYNSDYLFSNKEIEDFIKEKGLDSDANYKSFLDRLKSEDLEKEKEIEFSKKIDKIGYDKFKIVGDRKINEFEGEEGKEEFLSLVKKDNYRGSIFVNEKDKTIVYQAKGKNINEEKIRKYIRNLLESSFKK